MSWGEVPPGTVIPVRVGGKEYETIIDEGGVQRFREFEGLREVLDEGRDPSPAVLELAKSNTAVAWLVDNYPTGLNQMAIAFGSSSYKTPVRPPFTLRHYAEFNMMLGYSVGGFDELHYFHEYTIENPLWQDGLEVLAELPDVKEPNT